MTFVLLNLSNLIRSYAWDTLTNWLNCNRIRILIWVNRFWQNSPTKILSECFSSITKTLIMNFYLNIYLISVKLLVHWMVSKTLWNFDVLRLILVDTQHFVNSHWVPSRISTNEKSNQPEASWGRICQLSCQSSVWVNSTRSWDSILKCNQQWF